MRATEFEWPPYHVRARANIWPGDYYQGEAMTDLRISVSIGAFELSRSNVGEDEWARIEDYAATVLFDEAREKE